MVCRILRILFVHRPLDVRGGGEKVLEILVRELTRIGDEIRLVSMRKPDTHEGLMKFIERHPQQFTLLEEAYKSTRLTLQLSRHLGAMKSVTRLRIFLKRMKTDVAVSLPGSTEGAALSTLYLPAPRLVYVTGRISPAYGKPYQFLTRLLLRRNAHDILLGCRSMARDFAKRFSYQPPWLYPPYEETYFTPDPSIKRDNVIVMAGRISSVKRFHYGIIAAKKLHDKGIDFKLKIVGDVKYDPNRYYPYLLDLVDRLQLRERVEVIPRGDKNILREAYREALVVWSMGPFYFGLTNLEAVACGAVPVVAATNSEFVEATGVGYAVEDLDAAATVTANLIHQASDTRRIGLQASKRLAEKFGTKAFASAFRSLLTASITGKSQKVAR
jgi:glycosyltransferase involved in cell wall biosynthesis